MHRALYGIAIVLVACANPRSITCPKGRVCAAGTQCDLANDTCIVPSQLGVCDTLVDGAACTFDQSVGACTNGTCLSPVCGDGLRTEPEVCDPTSTAAMTTCDSAELGYYNDNPVACTSACQWDVVGAGCAGRCGNGVLEASEVCETDTAIAGTCIDYGFDRGVLACAACAPGFAGCGSIGWPGGTYLSMIELAVTAVGRRALIAGTTNFTDGLVGMSDGAGWTPLGTFPAGRIPYAIYAVTESDIWVAGAANQDDNRAMIAHWDGAAWAVVHEFGTGHATNVIAFDGHVFASAQKTLVHLDTNVAPAVATETMMAATIDGEIAGTGAEDVWLVAGRRLFHGGVTTPFTKLATPADQAVFFPVATAPNRVAILERRAGNGLALQIYDGTAWSGTPLSFPSPLDPKALVRTTDGTLVIGALDNLDTHVARFDGVRFRSIVAPRDFLLSHLAALDDDHLVAVDRLVQRAYRYTGSAWLTLDAPTLVSTLWAATPSDVWVADTFGQVLYGDGTGWMDTGAHGVLVDGVVAGGAPVVYALDSTDETSPALLWRVTGGSLAHPTPFDLESGTGLLAVRGVDDVFIVDNLGQLFHWDNPNYAMTNVPAGVSAVDCRPDACFAVAGTELWRVGTGNPTVWTKLDDIPFFGSGLAIAPTGDDVFVSGAAGHLAARRNAAWTDTQIVGGPQIASLYATSATDAFALTIINGIAFGSLEHYDGTTWAPVRAPIDDTTVARGVFTVGESTFVLTAEQPAIRRLERTTPW